MAALRALESSRIYAGFAVYAQADSITVNGWPATTNVTLLLTVTFGLGATVKAK
jgi:hypothetical protein